MMRERADKLKEALSLVRDYGFPDKYHQMIAFYLTELEDAIKFAIDGQSYNLGYKCGLEEAAREERGSE